MSCSKAFIWLVAIPNVYTKETRHKLYIQNIVLPEVAAIFGKKKTTSYG